MAMLNDCNFIGRVGKQNTIDFQKPSEGKPQLRFTLAVDQGKDQKGKEKEALWLHIICYGNLAELISGKLSQGMQVFVKGRLQLNSYTDKQGIDRQSLSINALDIQILEKKPEKAEQEV